MLSLSVRIIMSWTPFCIFLRLGVCLPVGRRFDKKMADALGHLLGLFEGEISVGRQGMVKHPYHANTLFRLKMEQYIIADNDLKFSPIGSKERRSCF